MWEWQGRHGDDVGMTWGPRGPWGQHGVETTETKETTGHGDHMGTFWGLWGWCGDDGDDMGMTWGWWGWCGDHGDYGDKGDTMGWRPRRQWRRPQRPQPWGTTWGHSGGYGDNVGMTGMTWGWRGQCGDHRDNKITKNAITFERIEIIEFCLKIWDPWTPPTHVHCNWCEGGAVPYPKLHFYPKSAPVTLKKKFFLFLHWIPLDHI